MEHIIAKLLQDFEQGKMSRRQLIQSLALTATAASAASAAPAAAADSSVIKAVNINHVSMQVADYAKTRDFYAGLLGMEVSNDNGKSCTLKFGNGILRVQNRAGRPGEMTGVDHIGYTLDNWDTDKNVKAALGAELKRRGLQDMTPTYRVLPGHAGPLTEKDALHTLHINDPDGLGMQMGGKDQ